MSAGEQTVVIVEDDANIAGLVEMYLRDAGFRVSVADRGERALDLVRARPRRSWCSTWRWRATSTASTSAQRCAPPPTCPS